MMDGIKPDVVLRGAADEWYAAPSLAPSDQHDAWGGSSFSLVPDQPEPHRFETASADWVPLAVIGAVALAGGIARLILSHRTRMRNAARIEQILSSDVRRLTENSLVGKKWLAKVSSDEQIRPDQPLQVLDPRVLATFSSKARNLVSDFALMLAFDRRAVTRVAQLAPTSFLMKYWKGINSCRMRDLKGLLHLVYNERHIEASNRHAHVRKWIYPEAKPISVETGLVGALHSVVAAQLAAQAADSAVDPDERARLFRAARDNVDLAIDTFSSGEPAERIVLLDRYGMDVIRNQTKALGDDIDIALRDAEGRPPKGPESPEGLFRRFPSSSSFQVIQGGTVAKFARPFMAPVFRPATVR